MKTLVKGLYTELYTQVERLISDLTDKQTVENSQFEDFRKESIVQLQELNNQIEECLQNPDINIKELAIYFFQKYSPLYEEFQNIEQYRYQVVMRYTEADKRMNVLLNRIYDEINPLQPPPFATNISNIEQYYWAFPEYGIIALPLGEDRNLINLPDLYHEIAHFVYNSYASYFYDIIEVWVQTHFTDEIERVDDENRDEKLKDIFSQSMKKWRENWIEEFMCDIIATYLVGTAYAWTNFKITILSSGNDEVYTDTEEHPSDESRMRVIFHVLSAMNADSVAILKDKWQDFLRITDNNKPDNYDNIFPEKLLKNIAEKIILQLDQTGLNSWKVQLEKSDKPVIWYLNQAWEILLNSPEKYAEKQAEMIEDIHDLG